MPRPESLSRGMCRRWLLLSAMASVCAAQASNAAQSPAAVDDAALADESRGEDWLAFGRTYSEQRFSPLRHYIRHQASQALDGGSR